MSELAGVAGLDVVAGLRHTAGKPDLYARVLRSFVATYGSGHPELSAAADAAGMARVAHSVRGASTTLGAAEVSRLADELERHCAAGACVEQLRHSAGHLNAALQSLAGQLAPRLPHA